MVLTLTKTYKWFDRSQTREIRQKQENYFKGKVTNFFGTLLKRFPVFENEQIRTC